MEMVAELKYKAQERKEVEVKKWEYEVNKVRYFCFLPAMWCIVAWVFMKKLYWTFSLRKEEKKIRFRKIRDKTNFFLFDGSSDILMDIKKGAASYKSIDLIYNYEIYRSKLQGISLVTSDFWCHMRNAQAVRNRKRLVAEELEKIIIQVSEENGRKPRILSIASGSAQAVLEAVGKARIPVELVLIDWKQEALEHSLFLVKGMGLEHLVSIKTKRASAFESGDIIKKFSPDVVEMVGFLDYLKDEQVVALFQMICSSVKEDTHFLTANICPNPERFFLEVVINWRMIYRKEKKLRQLVLEGGFKIDNICLEPQGIHALVVAQK